MRYARLKHQRGLRVPKPRPIRLRYHVAQMADPHAARNAEDSLLSQQRTPHVKRACLRNGAKRGRTRDEAADVGGAEYQIRGTRRGIYQPGGGH